MTQHASALEPVCHVICLAQGDEVIRCAFLFDPFLCPMTTYARSLHPISACSRNYPSTTTPRSSTQQLIDKDTMASPDLHYVWAAGHLLLLSSTGE